MSLANVSTILKGLNSFETPPLLRGASISIKRRERIGGLITDECQGPGGDA